MATIKEVAAHAEVSPATVSRVLNDHGSVDATLARRVRRAIDELGYQPSRTARALRRQRTNVWTLVVSDIRNAFFGEVARGIEDAALEADYAVVLCNSDDDVPRERAYVDLAIAERVAGVVLSPASASATPLALARLRAAGIPVVLVDRGVDGESPDVVTIDNREAARTATLHLVAQGFSRIGCICGPSAITTARDRIQGYRDALREAGRPADEALVREEAFKVEGGSRGAAALLELPEPPDALLLGNAPQCAGAVQLLRARGARIPEDVGVASFDDETWTSLASPSITTVAQPGYEIGREVAGLLRRRLDGDGGPPRRVLLEAELRVRASSLRHPDGRPHEAPRPPR